MESSGARPGTTGDLDEANQKIAILKDRYLPHIPHLLSITTDYPYRPEFPHENLNTPFAWWEVKTLQYMTLVSDGERGIAMAKGNWEDDFAGPASSTTTPNPKEKDPKKASVKYSIKDYKNMKQTGMKPSPKPEAERKLGHSRNISNLSLDSPMARVSSSEGQNGKPRAPTADERSAPRSSQEKPRPTMNGHAEHSLQNKDSNTKVSKPEFHISPTKHALPPRPPSPARERAVSDSKPHKRPLESVTAPPEKRTKVEVPSKTSSASQPNLPRKPETKPSPVKAQKLPAQDSPQSRKATPTSKPADLKISSKQNSNKPLDLPPLLSPLPADLENGPSSQPSGFATVKKVDSTRNSATNTPSKSKPVTDTIVVKTGKSPNPPPHADASPPPSPSRSQSPFRLPRLLSPSLPDIIEQELNRLQQKASVAQGSGSNTNTVEARHEKARQPGAPGVAQKAPKSKVGHPPKRDKAESSKSRDERPSLIIKLKYKKSSRKTIESLLKLRPTPNRQLQPSALPKDASDDSSSEDTPLATAIIAARKRISAEPPPAPAKRSKPADVDTPKSNETSVRPAFRSPAVTSAPNDRLLLTPKKNDAMKSVAMRRVDSNDGNAATPKATSTPASAEKHAPPRATLSSETLAEIAKLKADEKKFTTQASKLKHRMDDILKTKTHERESVPEATKKIGLATGLEGMVLYMSSFSNNVKIMKLQNVAPNPGNWESILKLWDFMDTHCRKSPVLNAVNLRIGVLCRVELRRVWLDERAKDVNIPALRANEREEKRLWRGVEASREVLEQLGVKAELGPWSSVRDIMPFVVDVLGRGVTGWKRDG